jgi:hypothetical protein
MLGCDGHRRADLLATFTWNFGNKWLTSALIPDDCPRHPIINDRATAYGVSSQMTPKVYAPPPAVTP